MLKMDFTETEVEELFYCKEHHPHPRVRKKMSVLYLKSQQLSHKEIKRLERISENTLLGYLNEYRQADGLEGLKKTRFYRPSSDLAAHTEKLRAHFWEHPPASGKEAASVVEALTGLKRSPDRVRIFLKGLGMEFRKVGTIPSKADVVEQEKSLTEKLESRLEETRNGKRGLFLWMPPTSG